MTASPRATKRKPRTKPAPTGNPPGRPSPIDVVVGEHPETGAPITVGDRIVNSCRAGCYFEPSAIAAGVTKETAYEWLRVAGRLRLRARGRPLEELDPAPTAHELRCLAFSDAVDEAQGVWEVGANMDLERLGRGGMKVVTVTEKHDAQGKLLEKTTKTETLAPNANVLTWRLTRRHPERYSQKIDVEGHIDGKITFTVEERAANLAEGLELYLAGAADAAAAAREEQDQ